MRRVLLALGLVAAAAPGCRGEPPPNSPTAPTMPTKQDEAEIRAVLERQKDAWNRGDIQAFMEGYHRRPDIVFTSAGKIHRGWDETLARYEQRYVSGDTMGHLEFRDVELQPVGPSGAVLVGRWQLTNTPTAGEGVFTVVLVKDAEGRWGIVHDHTSLLVP